MREVFTEKGECIVVSESIADYIDYLKHEIKEYKNVVERYRKGVEESNERLSKVLNDIGKYKQDLQ